MVKLKKAVSRKKEILNISTLEMFERLINKDTQPYDLNLMVMPGTLEDKHKNCENIPALRRQFNLIYLLIEGEHDVKLGAEQLQLNPNTLVIVPENMLYASDHIRHCKGFCIHFKTGFLKPQLSKPISDEFPYLHFDVPHILNLSMDESAIVQQAFKSIIAEFNRQSPERDFLLRSLILVLLYRIREIYRSHVTTLVKNCSRQEQIASRFRYLVEKHFIDKHAVADYAGMLHISPGHLSDAVKVTFGRTPLQMIHDMLLLEAKFLLGSSGKNISEIAHYLKFDDQSHFSHFFKKQTGMSPQQFRKMQ
jgi:AraC-like DNA-binding protein